MKRIIAAPAVLVLVISCSEKEGTKQDQVKAATAAPTDIQPTTPPEAHAQVAEPQPPDCKIPLPDPVEVKVPFLGVLMTSCPPATCGGNSPVVNNFPINGLRTDCVNGEGVWMVPGSLHVPGREDCSRKPLLVDPAGYLKAGECRHNELQSASFDVRIVAGTPASGTGVRSSTIVVHRAVNVALKRARGESEIAFAYEFRALGAKRSLCDREEAKQWRSDMQQGTHDEPFEDDDEDLDFELDSEPLSPQIKNLLGAITTQRPSDNLDNSLAIVRDGELFNKLLITIARGDQGFDNDYDKPWMSIQCLRDALAKTTLYRIAPQKAGSEGGESRDEYLSRRRSALKMLTANHCGTEHYTANGIEIRWDTTPFDDPPPPEGLQIEAAWGETSDGKNQALCISEARAWFREWSERKRTMPEYVFPTACRGRGGDPGRCTTEKKFRMELQKECKVEKCDPQSLPPGTKMVSYKPRKKRWAK